jgi:aminoglycoside phosphotransferase family enzyme
MEPEDLLAMLLHVRNLALKAWNQNLCDCINLNFPFRYIPRKK